MYYLQLISSKSCNQKCYYCNVFEKERKIIIDIDFLKYVLDSCPCKIGVELTGGEIGLVENLDLFFTTIYDHKNIDRKCIKLLSNGLVRKIGFDWLDKIIYWEHLIFDIKDRDIIKFYDLDLVGKHKYIIVTTETTTKSLLKNWSYFEGIGLLRDNFFYKIMNGKTHDIKNYSGELYLLFNKLNDIFSKRMIEGFVMNNNLHQKLLCSANSPNPFVDFDTKELGHCGAFVPESIKVKFHKLSLNLMMSGSLFRTNLCTYCNNCYVFDNGFDKEEYIQNCKQKKYRNRSYKNEYEKSNPLY